MKKILLWVLLVFGLIQLIPVDRTNKPLDTTKDFGEVVNVPPSVKKMLVTSCYDCHSNQVNYPAYAYIAPFSWSIRSHIKEGREHVNFSEWTSYNSEQKEHILEEVIEVTENKEMPFKGYLPLHPEANLTDAQRKDIADYFRGLMKSGKY